MIDNKIEFDERWDRDDGTTELFFVAPVELLNGKYPEAESTEIMIEIPSDRSFAENAVVSFSPTMYDSEDESYTDYDWFEVDMACEDIEALIALAENEKSTNRNDNSLSVRNTKFSYMYRDSANYKTFFECIFPGELTSEQISKIISACGDEYFIPRAVGFPGGMFDGESGYDSQYDHYWCEHDFEESFSLTSEAPTHFISADELVSAFLRCKGCWEEQLFDDVSKDIINKPTLNEQLHVAEGQKADVGVFFGSKTHKPER